LVLAVTALLCAGGALTAAGAAPKAASKVAPAAPAKGSDGMQIEGTVGELDSAACEKVLQEHRETVKKCFESVSERLFYLGGHIEVKLRIGASGQPSAVAMVASSLGNYEVEHCVTSTMHKLRFPPPKGGDGELSVPFDFAAHTPVGAWPPDKVAGELGRAKLKSCSARKPHAGERLATAASVQVTLYIGPGGKVTSVGFAAPEPIDDKMASCMANKVKALQLDDPLGKMVKVSYDLGGGGGE
jgi:outer membrane biosynthesis protein TonB